MFGASGVLFSTNYNNNGEKLLTQVSDNIVIPTIQLVSDSNWVPLNFSGFIKSQNADSPFVNSSTSSGGDISLTFTTSSDGNHLATTGGTYAQPYVSSTVGSGQSTYANPSGSHSHTTPPISIAGTSLYPFHLKTKMYTRATNSNKIFTLPIGTIVFGENIEDSGVVATSTYSSLYLYATTNDADVGRIGGGTTSRSINLTTSQGGSHNHGATGVRAQNGYNPAFGSEKSAAIDTNQSTGHTHSLSASLTQYIKYMKLNTYIVQQENVYIRYGMIFGFTSNNVPPNWYCCNGQTIDGYTTPNLVDRYVMFGYQANHKGIPPSAYDKNALVLSNVSLSTENWFHYHGTGDGWQTVGNYGRENRYHSTVSVPHTHTITTSSSSIDYEPPNYNLIYYIYLP
jgi:hypothetical protein